MDRRLTPANERVALESLRGMVKAPRFTKGEPASVATPVADLLDQPAGRRDRQVLFGEAVTIIERAGGWAFVQARKDGYCGYLQEEALGPEGTPTHRVAALATHVYQEPRVQARESATLSFGALLQVSGEEGKFAITPQGFVPSAHLWPVTSRFDDPVGVAEMFFGTPYLWGGNSRLGIDCSGLVQASLIACGVDCPGDSDMQQSVGQAIPDGASLRRGDLLFWKGHVAMVVDAERLIHANGHTMSVAYEPVETCISRIMAQEGRPVVARRRPILNRQGG